MPPRTRWKTRAHEFFRYLLMQLVVNVSYGIPVAIGLYFIGVPNAASGVHSLRFSDSFLTSAPGSAMRYSITLRWPFRPTGRCPPADDRLLC